MVKHHFLFSVLVFVMALDHNKTWPGYLTAHIIDQCIAHCEADCPGCRDGVLSPLLHWHNRFDLRTKVDRYFFTVKNKVDVSALFDAFHLRFGFFSKLNREKFVNSGECFVDNATPTSLVFGDFITHSLDYALYGEFMYQEQGSEYTAVSPQPTQNTPESLEEPTQPQKSTKELKKRKNVNQEGTTPKKRKRAAIKAGKSEEQFISHHDIFGDGSTSPKS